MESLELERLEREREAREKRGNPQTDLRDRLLEAIARTDEHISNRIRQAGESMSLIFYFK